MGHTQESSEAICVEQEESLSEEAAKEAVEERKMPDRRVLRKKLHEVLEEKWEYRYKPENKYTEEEVRDLRAEARVENRIGMKWQERGPPGPDQGGPTTWRSQPFRIKARKWAKRGGTKQEYFKQKFGKTGWGTLAGIAPKETTAQPEASRSSSSTGT